MAEKRSKTDFDKTWQYQRILEILDCYWLSQPDEEYVEVKMYFRHKSGEEKTKHIVWSSEPDDFCSKDAVPVKLTVEEINTIRIHMNAHKETLCNQHRWKEAEEYQQIVDKLDTMMDEE